MYMFGLENVIGSVCETVGLFIKIFFKSLCLQ